MPDSSQSDDPAVAVAPDGTVSYLRYSPQGYATYLRPFSIQHGWLAPVTQVSSEYGNPAIWPGDTFGISVLPDWNGGGLPEHVALGWGSAVGGSQNSEIYATVVGR